MKEIVLVAIGGACGSVMRLKLGGLILHGNVNIKFPLSTFTINMVGCLLIGVFAGFIARHEGIGSEWRSLVMTGILGGFTTFSAFGFETAYLIREHHLVTACAYALLSVIAGVASVFLGLWGARVLP